MAIILVNNSRRSMLCNSLVSNRERISSISSSIGFGLLGDVIAEESFRVSTGGGLLSGCEGTEGAFLFFRPPSFFFFSEDELSLPDRSSTGR